MMEHKVQHPALKRYPKYKDSGVEWLGEIPEDWASIRFQFLTKIEKGKLPKKVTNIENDSLPVYLSMEYLRGASPNQWVCDRDSKTVAEGELLLLWDGSNSGEFILSRAGVISSTVALIKSTGIDKKFLWYYSKIIERELRRNTIGMGIPHVNGDFLKNITLLIPSQLDQQTIARFLDEKTAQIDKAIAIKERQIALLKERQQVLIQQAVTKGLDPDVPLKDSGVEWIGEIPAHWEVKRLNNLFRETNIPGDDTLPLLSVSIHNAVSSEQLDDEDNIQGRVKIENKSNYKKVDVGYIVYNMMRAWQGAIGAVDTTGMVSPAYVVAKPLIMLESKYYEHLFRTALFIQQMDRFSRGITDFRKRLYWPDFKQLKVMIPPYTEQREILNYISHVVTKSTRFISLKQTEIEKLKEYKTSLIDRVVTGKVRVSQY